MTQHEMFTNSSASAVLLAAGLVGADTHAYPVQGDTELHCVTVVRRYDRDEMVSLLDRMNIDYIDVVTTFAI